MLNFINNWARPIELASGTETAPLDLPDGEYLLTIADSPTAASRWEIVRAEVDGGVATLQRGQEETLAQAWPEGSVIYCSVTAGTLNEIMRSEGAPGGGWGKIGSAANYEAAGVVSYTLSPTDVDVHVGSGGVGYDVELAIPEDLPPGAAMRVPVRLSMYWGSSLLIRAPGPLGGVAITSGVAATTLEDNGRVLRMLFEDGPGVQALFSMDLSVARDGDYYYITCALREQPEEIYLPDQPIVDH